VWLIRSGPHLLYMLPPPLAAWVTLIYDCTPGRLQNRFPDRGEAWLGRSFWPLWPPLLCTWWACGP